ncbi:putative UDP-sugar transporter DDB_G0278631 [Dreissena polymorpha]|uniref:Sugar phosphate transporter domain-containing protein n=1 Tax=Dreissena polymorpha TaxID=45954 RepID=A0A9D4LRA8_DREPO|nr:putative UDP-sugar transporter DDB_G0278631 [Dreissena polymorpha]KAH3862419.1 hypothetical protein DPMN_025386 [Dreissena polymorpha]
MTLTDQHSVSGNVKANIAAVSSAVLYGASSVAIVYVNKLLMTSFSFDYPVFIMASQMTFTILLLELLSLINIINMPKYTLERAKMFALPALFYGVNSVLALSALSNMNPAMYGVLKRCVPVVTLLMSVVIFKKGWPSRLTILSVLMLTLGCVVAGYGDLKFNMLAYTCGALSNVTQAAYLLLVQRLTKGKLTTVESLQLNSINTLPFLILICVTNGEVVKIRTFEQYHSISFIAVFILAISLGCLLNYSLFLCTSLNSALTTSIVGGIKALAQTLLGVFTFGGVSHNLPTFAGLSMSMLGAVFYLYAKYTEHKTKHLVDLKKVMTFSAFEELKDDKELNEMEIKINGVTNQAVFVEMDKRAT